MLKIYFGNTVADKRDLNEIHENQMIQNENTTYHITQSQLYTIFISVAINFVTHSI